MKLRVAAMQTGSMSLDLDANLGRLTSLFEQAAADADLVVFPEMITAPYFPVAPHDVAYGSLARPVPGPLTEGFASIAASTATAVLLGTYEQAEDGSRYNSVVHLDSRGELVRGTMHDGSSLPAYRKIAVANVSMPGFSMDEQVYCSFGQGPALFEVDGLGVGTAICYDRAFSEVWMALSALGADVVCLAVSSFGWREALFVDDLRLRAMEFGVFVVAANRSGVETVGGVSTDYFGRSCIIAPDGEVLAEAGAHTGDEIIVADVDLDAIEAARRTWVVGDRRPELFSFLYRETAS